VLLGLCIGAYFIFQNSAAGKFLGSLFGDANAVVDWLGDQLKNCTQNGLTSSSCSLGPWIIGGLVILGIGLLLKGASLLKPLLPEGTRKFTEEFGYDGKDAMDDFNTAQAEFNEKFENGTLSKPEQTLLDKYKNNPEAQAGVKDALTSARANGMTSRRRLETVKSKENDPVANKKITDAVEEQTQTTRTDIKDDAVESGVEDDSDLNDGMNAAENAY
jgi:hypothetical protein